MRGFILITFIASVIFIAGCTTGSNEQVFCTEEAKICADGTAVGRNPEKNCEFDPCTVEFVVDADQCEGGKVATCTNGKQYDRWNVVDGKCFEINYFVDPCQDFSGGRVMQITQEICQNAGGSWNECGSPCAGAGQDFCILMCQQQCECGGIAGFTCPVGYDCRLSGKIADEIGVCVPRENV